MTIIFAACGATATPAPTTSLQDAPSALGRGPISTREPTPTSTLTEKLTTLPSPTLAPECVGVKTTTDTATIKTSSLLEVLEMFPLSLKDEGLWYGDLRKNLAEAGAPIPRTLEELFCLDTEDREKYESAFAGRMVGITLTGLLARMRSYALQWPEVFGFDFPQVSLSTSFTGTWSPRGPSYLEGTFDADEVRRNLLGLGYQEEEHAGRAYYSTRQDYGQNLRDPGGRLSLSSMNRVYITDDILIAASYTEFMRKVFDAMDGTEASLADDPAFFSLSLAMKDPLAAVLLTRSAYLDPEGSEGLFYETFEKPAEWGELHQWEALGAGYRRQADSTERITFALFYSDPDAAKSDEAELLGRMLDYTLEHQGGAPGESVKPFMLWCDSLTADAQAQESGSTLSITCNNASSSGFWGAMVAFQGLGFLSP